ncbi:hypothetical protein DPEC_G00104830 [Dallia pectoralis]|uniref:Uncharacterized protein n=1 Tax=Dallia pectoralis TaxID=75939 RepID=A0ACC2GXJ7_DALPE|nr:hypothetical protein DPEC_G00104830 [Dallia pectoralis]
MTDSLFNTIIFLLILKTCEILNRIRQIIRSVKTPKIGLHELDNEGLSIMGSTGGDKVYHGLYNEGATCYLNSVLQVLFMTKVFREALECNSEEKYIVDFKLKRLFTTLMENETYTKDILLTLGIENVHEQCDAAEYFEKILSMVNPKASKLFKGELRHSTTCSNGHITSNEIGPFWTLPLSMADPLDSSNTYCVNDGFCDFFKSSTVSGENQMYCDDCEMKADATIECRMEVYPDILTLLLKRFEFDYYTMTYVKINRSVEVPHTLQTEEHDYELYAIVDHFGTLRGGHYTAKIKSFEDHNWYVFRDSYVKKLCFQPNSKRTERSNSAYLLVYKKSLVKNEHTTNQIPVNPGDEVAGEPVEIKTSEDDDPDDAGLEEHGHASVSVPEDSQWDLWERVDVEAHIYLCITPT